MSQLFASGGQIIGVVKVLNSICQQIWKTQPWPQDWKRSIFIPIPRKSNAKECSNCHTVALISHASIHWRRKRRPTPMFLPGESQGWGSLVGCHLWDQTESDTTEATSSSSSSSKVMLKILQARLQWYVNCELPDVQTGFRKGRGTRD